MTTRRQFLGASAALAAAGRGLWTRTTAPDVEPAAKALDVLVLGGTGFIGPHQIEHALARGHRVTMFNRGRRGNPFGNRVEELIGDRDANVNQGLEALEGDRRWDVVIDNSGYVPRHVRDSAALLRDRCERYVFVSTVAVYDYERQNSVDRDGPLLEAPEPATEQVTGETYGPLKAECERQLRAVRGSDVTIVRPCYIVGPGDTTDRFTYWVERLHRGGDVVCPAFPEHEAQWIDARDLCPFMLHLAEQGTTGAFNGVGPRSKVTNEMLMHGLRAFASEPTTLWWPSADLVDELDYATPMFDWGRIDRHTHMGPAVAAGLRHRSLAETARDTHAWWLAQPEERRANPRRWPSIEEEQALLARLRG
ncbi:MAG: NAD-dependent epimerase/dehydratase family protein [Planctomycetota bacterium]